MFVESLCLTAAAGVCSWLAWIASPPAHEVLGGHPLYHILQLDLRPRTRTPIQQEETSALLNVSTLRVTSLCPEMEDLIDTLPPSEGSAAGSDPPLRRRVRPARRRVFSARLALEAKAKFGVVSHTEPNLKIVDAWMRTFCKDHNMRSADIVSHVPMAVNLFFLETLEEEEARIFRGTRVVRNNLRERQKAVVPERSHWQWLLEVCRLRQGMGPALEFRQI
jgi:hypothetical protein